MPLDISFQPLRVLIDGHDGEGNLVLWNRQLAAVIVRLDGEHHDPDHKGWWHLEAGFGKCDSVWLHPCSKRLKRPEPGWNEP